MAKIKEEKTNYDSKKQIQQRTETSEASVSKVDPNAESRATICPRSTLATSLSVAGFTKSEPCMNL